MQASSCFRRPFFSTFDRYLGFGSFGVHLLQGIESGLSWTYIRAVYYRLLVIQSPRDDIIGVQSHYIMPTSKGDFIGFGIHCFLTIVTSQLMADHREQMAHGRLLLGTATKRLANRPLRRNDRISSVCTTHWLNTASSWAIQPLEEIMECGSTRGGMGKAGFDRSRGIGTTPFGYRAITPIPTHHRNHCEGKNCTQRVFPFGRDNKMSIKWRDSAFSTPQKL